MSPIRVLPVVLLTAFLACTPGADEKKPDALSPVVTEPQGSGIVFSSTRDGNPEIYTMTLEGKEPRRLTNHLASDTDPCWSPDKKQIAFISDREGAAALYTMRADGTQVRRLTRSTKLELFPAWSPDGTRIAFERASSGWSHDLFTIKTDGTGEVQLTATTWNESRPAWSPDGVRLAYCCNATGSYALYVMRADGTEPRLIAPKENPKGTWEMWSPVWTQDGSRILCCSEDPSAYPAKTKRVYSMNPDGSDLRVLIYFYESQYWYDHLGLSRDGKSILFSTWENTTDKSRVCTGGLPSNPLTEIFTYWSFSPEGKDTAPRW